MIRLQILPRTLRTRLAIAFSALLLFSITVIALVLARQAAITQLDMQQQLGRNLIQAINPAMRDMVAARDSAGIENHMQKINIDSVFSGMRITDSSGLVLYEQKKDALSPRWIRGSHRRCSRPPGS